MCGKCLTAPFGSDTLGRHQGSRQMANTYETAKAKIEARAKRAAEQGERSYADFLRALLGGMR